MKKKILIIAAWSLLIFGLLFLLGFLVKEQGNSRCREVKITINYPEGDYFVTEKDIWDYITRTGDSLKGSLLSRIDIETIEEMIRQNPYVARAEVFSTLDGVIRIEVQQCRPIVRVQNQIGQQFYISDDGRLIPLNPGKPARVMLACGHIRDIFLPGQSLKADTAIKKEDSALVRTALYKVYKTAEYITGDPFLKAQIEQIFVNRDGDLELLPMVGGHLIILGDADNLQEKFSNLMIFYRQALPEEGWDKYDTLNLKFHNQIVCTKKNQTNGI